MAYFTVQAHVQVSWENLKEIAQKTKTKTKTMALAGEEGTHLDQDRVLVGKPEGNRPLGRPKRRWEDNIKMDLQEMGGGGGAGWSWLRIGTGGGHL